MSKRNRSNEDIQIYLDSINREEDTAPIQIEDDTDNNNNDDNDDDDDDDEEASVVLVQANLGKKRKILSDPIKLANNRKLTGKVMLTKISHLTERKTDQGPKAPVVAPKVLQSGAAKATQSGGGAPKASQSGVAKAAQSRTTTGAGAVAKASSAAAVPLDKRNERNGKSDLSFNELILPNNVKVKKEFEDPSIIILSDAINETRVSKRSNLFFYF